MSRQSESYSQSSSGKETPKTKKVRQKRGGKGRRSGAREGLTPISKYLVKEEPPNTDPGTSKPQAAGDGGTKSSETSASTTPAVRGGEGGSSGSAGQLETKPPTTVAREPPAGQRGRETSERAGEVVKSQPKKREKRVGAGGREGVRESSSSSSQLPRGRQTRGRKTEPQRSSETPVVRRQVQSSIRDHFPVRRSGRKTKSEIEKEEFDRTAQRLRNKDESGLKVVEVEGKGRGVVSSRPFSQGELVCEYSGELISLEEARRREEKYSEDTSVGCYMYYFSYKNSKLCVDATADNGRKGRLLNHSRTAANAVTRLLEVDQRPYLCLVAARDISVGEQLEYDYGERDRAAVDSHPWLAT